MPTRTIPQSPQRGTTTANATPSPASSQRASQTGKQPPPKRTTRLKYPSASNARLLGLWMLVCLLALCSGAKAQLASFGNTGFESGNTSWTTSVPSGSSATMTFTSGTPTNDIHQTQSTIIHAGTRAFQANVTNPGSNYPSLTHSTFTADANGTYMVSFWLWSGSNQAVNRPNMKLHIRSGGPSYDVLFQPSNVGWDEFHWTFKASGSTTLSFTFEQAATFCVDDVRVFDQNDTGMDVLTQYVSQWGYQNTNNSSNSNIRQTCLTGADNCIAAQLPDGRTLWFFNDSFIGGINYSSNLRYASNDPATSGYSFVRNYVAMQSVDKSTFTPLITTPGTTFLLPPQSERDNQGAIYWPNDAITENDKVQVLLDEPSNGGAGGVIHKRIGTLSPPNYNSPVYTDFAFGNFALNGGDGYIYIYDTDGKGGMALARAAYGSLTNVNSWQWWQGSGNSFGAKPSTLPTVQGLFGGTRSLERMGPGNAGLGNFLAGGDNGNDFQFAQYPWGPWTSIARYSPIDVTTHFYDQASNNYYYYFILHKELAQNGVYTVGYSDNGGNELPAGSSTPYTRGENYADGNFVFAVDQKSKGYYAPRYIKSNNLLAASPYTLGSTASFSEAFNTGFSNNTYETVWWQPYGGNWTISNFVYGVNSGYYGFYSILKGVLRGNFTLEADVACVQNGSDGYAGVIFRGSNYAYGHGNFKGYSVVLIPGTGARLLRNDGNGSVTTLATANLSINANQGYHVKVVASGSSLQAYINNSSTPQISVTDGTYSSGGVGLRAFFSPNATFDNFSVHQ